LSGLTMALQSVFKSFPKASMFIHRAFAESVCWRRHSLGTHILLRAYENGFIYFQFICCQAVPQCDDATRKPVIIRKFPINWFIKNKYEFFLFCTGLVDNQIRK